MNLVDVDGPYSGQLGNRAFSEKCETYGGHGLLLSRSLGKKPQNGTGKLDMPGQSLFSTYGFDCPTGWTQADVVMRLAAMLRLACSAWGITTTTADLGATEPYVKAALPAL